MTRTMITDLSRMEDAVRGRVCFLVRGMDGGGAQKDAVLLANAVQALGRPAAIVTLDSRGALADQVDEAVPIIDLGRGGKLRLAQSLGALRKVLAAGPSAFVASEAAANGLTVLAARLVARARRPLIVLREVASPSQARRSDPFWQNRLGYLVAPLTYRMADVVVTFTAGVRNDLIANFGIPATKVVSLGTNAVITAAMRTRIANQPRRPAADLIVSVGRLSPEKNPLGLLDAFALLRKHRPARLLMLGDGSEAPALRQRVTELGLAADVTLAGYQADPLPFLAEATLFVSASQHEGLGNAIIEAMAYGVPIVATDAPHGPREILEGGRLGSLVPVGDAAALAEAMSKALDQPADVEAVTARAAAFSAEAAGARFVDMLVNAGMTKIVSSLDAAHVEQ